MELKDIKTCELVEELKRREGVVCHLLTNYETICEILDEQEEGRVTDERYTGPGTTILVIGD